MNDVLSRFLSLENILMYLVIVNILGFLAMGLDKLFAKANMWRIKEKTLVILTLIGGGIGTTLGMFLFRHKITKGIFKQAFITITLIEAAAITFCIIKFAI